MKKVILIDAGTGNLRSVQKALETIGADVERTDDPRRVISGGRVVLPGVGAFGEFMSELRRRGLDDGIREVEKRGIPLLGICVGMQALFDVGAEMGPHAGLGLLAGRVVQFQPAPSIKIPHTGWNQVEVRHQAPLFRSIKPGTYVYFNHSYYCQPSNSSEVLATTDYGLEFACAVGHDNAFGVQFHPEKSQSVGLRILENFLGAE
ncbi:MAG TPA: imidazole glycerol phosphate synthase subunit HisH [Anaerolineales bacterium]|nr:imidazole glycerol phosphate synthase subunit HisH [Anaerolineales bacterium]